MFNVNHMAIAIALSSDKINQLDLSPAVQVIEQLAQAGKLTSSHSQISFEINYPREPNDPRELSEISAIRLWFVRLDVYYPWLILLLDGQSGELYRYVAMLVPHQFSRAEGIQYNPEALEIFVMQKIFIIARWLKEQGVTSTARLKLLAQALGYEIEDQFFESIF